MSTAYRASESNIDSWVKQYLQPRYPELVTPFLEAFDLCKKAHSSGILSETDAQRLLEHARSNRTPLGENAATFLGELCDSQTTAREALRLLASSNRVDERINALVALESCQTSDLHEELLASALSDRSARVRALAADRIVGHGLKSLLAKLHVAIEKEKDANLKVELVTSKELLMQSYAIRHEGEYVYVICRLPNWSSTSRRFSLAEFESEGEAWIAKHTRTTT